MILSHPIADLNPQLIREVKGRLTRQSLWLTIGGPILIQIVLLLIFQSLLPHEFQLDQSNRYCWGDPRELDPLCTLDPANRFLLNMSLWWQDIFRLITWVIPTLWIGGSVYVLIGDLTKERKQGTLNFIQLSPRSSTTILMGKLLGVPILLHLPVLTFLPLHLVSALWGQISPFQLLCFYGVLLGLWGVLGTGALLFASLGGSQPWLGATLVTLGIYPLLWMISHGLWGDPWTHWGEELRQSLFEVAWFDLPVGSHVGLGSLFLLISCGVAMGWIWWTLTRRFGSVDLTVLSKRSSYLLTLCLHLTGMGFLWSTLSTGETLFHFNLHDAIVLFWILQIPFWLALIWSLTPHRQAILDWVYYRREQASFQPFTLLRDLVWGEKSPMVLALGINLGIVLLLWLSFLLLIPMPTVRKFDQVLALLAPISLWWIYGVVGQLLLLPRGHRRWWNIAGLLGVLFVPLVGGSLWVDVLNRSAGIWIFFVYGAGSAYIDRFPLPGTLIGLTLPWLLLGVLIGFLITRIQNMGRSETQRILSSVE